MTDGVYTVTDAADLEGVPDGPIGRLGADAWALTRPDIHLVRVEAGALVGRLSVWAEGPPVPGRPDARAGCLGHAAWTGPEVGEELVEAGAVWLRDGGATVALGPMDGSTWFAYRVVTESDGSPPFAMEPTPPPVVAEAFGRAGFEPVAHYLSSRIDALPDLGDEAAEAARRLGDTGLRVRPFTGGDAEAELRRLYPLLLRAFADNAFYAPLDEPRFLATYGTVLPYVDPRLVLIAEREGRPVGVVLALPDAAQAARGEAVDTLLVKTLAVDPAERGRGLGGALVLLVQEEARRLGVTRAVHALMHAENASVRISRHLGVPFRRYALLGRDL